MTETTTGRSYARTSAVWLLDNAVSIGDIDAAVAFAKELAYIDGSNERTVGMTAMIHLVASVERVTKS